MDRGVDGLERRDGEDAVTHAIRTRFLRKCWGLANQLRLTDSDRHDLARMVHGVDADSDGSWASLNERQLRDLSLMLEGYLLVSYVMSHHVDRVGG